MRFLRPLIRVIVYTLLAIPLLLVAFQDKMIYHPRPYPETQVIELREKQRKANHVEPLEYSTSQGRQQAFYIPPRSRTDGKVPSTLWVFFNGNGSLALEWMYLVSGYPLPEDGFLLVEYPGYGNCSGHPSSKAIQESADAALGALAVRLGVGESDVETRLKVLGHSLGSAAALGFAANHASVSRVVLLAPFSSMEDMARRTVGPLCCLLRENYDNRACVRKISSRVPPPQVEILSGGEDTLIPFTMGRELAGISPKAVHFQTVEGAGHNSILEFTDRIYAAMTGVAGVQGAAAGDGPTERFHWFR